MSGIPSRAPARGRHIQLPQASLPGSPSAVSRGEAGWGAGLRMMGGPTRWQEHICLPQTFSDGPHPRMTFLLKLAWPDIQYTCFLIPPSHLLLPTFAVSSRIIPFLFFPFTPHLQPVLYLSCLFPILISLFISFQALNLSFDPSAPLTHSGQRQVSYMEIKQIRYTSERWGGGSNTG